MYTCVSRFEQIVYFLAAQRGGSEKETRLLDRCVGVLTRAWVHKKCQ